MLEGGTKKYKLDTEENQQFLCENAMALFLFGRKFPSPGGSSYYLSDDGTPWTERPRETWITGRMVHVYSIGAMLGMEGCLELAQKGIQGLAGELRDEVNGGWYAALTADGGFVPGKQCYAHAFVILAAASATLAAVPGAQELLKDALAIYDQWFWNDQEGLSCDTWDTEFKVLDPYRGINANMHTVEAFLAVADTLGNEQYRTRAGRIIEHVCKWARENQYRIPEHFTSDWNVELEKNKEKPDDPFKPYGATPGHGIEWSRLITQWAMSSKNLEQDEKDAYVEIACRLYERAIEDGWNADGNEGIVYTTDWEGKPIVHDRMHWTLAEAINTSAVLYRVTGNQKYSRDYEMFIKYLDTTVLDHETGSWFHQLDAQNKRKDTVWPGKPDLYHAVQAMLIPYLTPDLSIAAAVRA